MDILIFKTNLKTMWDFNFLKSLLLGLPFVYDCTIDLDDCDKVLRVITDKQSPEAIMNQIKNKGFFCEELED